MRHLTTTSAAENAIDSLDSFAWLIFTSRNAVAAFFARLSARNADARSIGKAKVAAIGERTAESLRGYGIRADVVPEVFVGEEVARAVLDQSHVGDRVLVFRAQEARDVLVRMLEEAGLVVTVVPAYKTVVPSDSEFEKKIARADVLTFTSASTVRGFAALLGGDAAASRAVAGKCIACIGPITARAASEAGLEVDVVASRFTISGLLDALDAILRVALLMQIALGALLAALVASLAYRARALSAGGAAAAFAVGAVVFASGGWAAASILFAFFLPSTLLSRIGGVRNRSLRAASEKLRAANGKS